MSAEASEYANRCSWAAYAKLIRMADLSQLILGYLATREGVA
jgi:hypothetical protein